MKGLLKRSFSSASCPKSEGAILSAHQHRAGRRRQQQLQPPSGSPLRNLHVSRTSVGVGPSVSMWSFNLRSDFNAEVDGENRWEMRRGGVVDMLKGYDPDIIATQEVIAAQVSDLADGISSYDYEGCCRLGGQEDEYCAIFFKKDRFEVVKGDTIWLSESPEEPGSIGWDAMYPRIATWAVLKTKEEPETYLTVISTHFDHVGIQARKESAKLLKELIRKLQNEYPMSATVLAGDFNSVKEGNEVYTTLTSGEGGLSDAWSTAGEKADGGWKYSTMHKFQGLEFNDCMGDGTVELCEILPSDQDDMEEASDGKQHIDWILVADSRDGTLSLSPKKSRMFVDTLPSGRYPSDHFPVGTDFEIKASASTPRRAGAELQNSATAS